MTKLWRDALGGMFRCTAAGTPGTWTQIRPAAGDGRPVERNGSDGLPDLNVTQGTLKRHAGGYSWETIVGAAGDKVGFYGATPVVHPSGANQVAVTFGNTDGENRGLTVSDLPTQAEFQALRGKCEQLADDVRALSTPVHALRGALVGTGLAKGSA
ncbi:MAG TPA: hypothetical protein PLY00_16135 [Verrucomicrobiota bacterium]|jgi:hypothetical protein|nr:MAG: hypothetical protein BWX48_03243 [Verrucomicrobia bacterium ADurb.Bin006]HOA62462.1 hypothetical protein [Verrucomicrobiota bacterium]HPG01297.1 hypothetical protein [Kiritimatiellia bacterium]HOF49746.1 hypothetical protein [Verrucomicrobiota bacterium]HOG88387.1 hypothetical protein [Verrucomicrobiota bacterium]